MTRITAELRCLVCQNQTIADSNAGLAVDLRRETREMLRQGKSDAGDRRLHDRPLRRLRALPAAVEGDHARCSGSGPAAMLLLGGTVLLLVLRRRTKLAADAFEPDADDDVVGERSDLAAPARRPRSAVDPTAATAGHERRRRLPRPRRAAACSSSKSLHDAGRLDAKTYDAERRAVEQEIGAHLLAQAPATPRPRPSGATGRRPDCRRRRRRRRRLPGDRLAGARRRRRRCSAADHVAGSGSDAAGERRRLAPAQQQIAAMVDKLAARMKERPDDVEGWIMLARSYTVLGRFAEALPAYAPSHRAAGRQSASLLADYADTVAATKRTANNPESIALIERALNDRPGAIPKALALAGTVDYDRGDYARAIARWQAILDRVAARERARPADHGEHRRCARQARRRGAARDGERLRRRQARAATASARPVPRAARSNAAFGAPAVSGTVTLDPALAAQGRARRHRVRLRPRRRRRPDAARGAEGPGRRPAPALQARRQHGDGAGHDRVERQAGDRRRPHQQVGPGDAERRRPRRARPHRSRRARRTSPCASTGVVATP